MQAPYLLFVLPWLCSGAVYTPEAQDVITSRQQLNAKLESGPNRQMGFLSEANFNSVHTVLSKKVVPVYFAHTQELYDAVEAGTVIAGLISGVPDRTRFSVFSSDLISPRSFQMTPDASAQQLMEAVDAAVVRTHHFGQLLKAQERSPPFEAVEVHTCRADDPEMVAFPDPSTATGLLKEVLDTKKLKILSYGEADKKPDWHQDGNYTAEPPTGFWPYYMDYFMVHFKAAYGNDIELERVWMTSGGTEAVLSGEIHMTEPYYIYENLYDGELKKWNHRFSCVVMGYEQQFFSKAATIKVIDDGAEAEPKCPAKLEACVEARRVDQINSRLDLNAKLEAGPNRKMGFLSEANYRSVAPVITDQVEPVIYSDSQEIFDHVFDGTLVAGLISGVPDRSNFSVFSTDLISPRSFQMMPGNESRDLMMAVDAAVVRTHNAAELMQAEQANPPFQAVEVHTCRSDNPSVVPFPNASTATGLLRDVLDTRRLKILSYGEADSPPNWAQDGNYQVTPHTGFWPDYMDMWMAHFKTAYGDDIALERVWMTSGGTELVLNGTIHMTEPYYIYENLWSNQLKKWSHEFSCVVMGYEQNFFAQKAMLDFSSAGESCEEQLAACEKRNAEVSNAALATSVTFWAFLLPAALISDAGSKRQ